MAAAAAAGGAGTTTATATHVSQRPYVAMFSPIDEMPRRGATARGVDGSKHWQHVSMLLSKFALSCSVAQV